MSGEMVDRGTGEVVEMPPAELQQMPQAVIDHAKKAATALQSVIAGKKKPVMFNGEQYIEFEDWQLIGKFYGLMAKTRDAEPFMMGDINGAKAQADVIDLKTGQVVGGATAYCMRDEKNWEAKPWFQLASMAQTRAAAKALRNLLAWVVVLAGYRPTPAEELPVDQQQPMKQPQATSAQGPRKITEGQAKRFYAIWRANNRTAEEVAEYLESEFGIKSDRDIPVDGYEGAIAWAERK